MGIAALKKLLPTQPFDPAQLAGRTLAVDADNLIWSFVTALAGTDLDLEAPHLFGLVGRLTQYAKWGARSVWVFDGAQPDLKQGTLIARAERIEAARAAGENKQAMASVGEAELSECRDALSALGVPWTVAPGESDAQCADLVQRGKAWAAVTQDWDIALFGAPRALRNLTLSKTRPPELLDLSAALGAAGLTREQLVDVAILIGTDYNEGVRGVGPVKAVALVKRGEMPDVPDLDRVRELFLRHPVDAAFTPKHERPEEAKARAVLEARGVSAKRVDDLLSAMRGVAGGRQTTLS
jgi:flap endonuclease-1